jgi:hypothetical protein
MYIYILLYLIIGSYGFNLKILTSPIFNFHPKINLHHIVVLYENDYSYTLDFSPTNQSTNTLFRLFIGQDVDSHIKIKYVKLNDTIYNIGSKNYINVWEKQPEIKIDDIKNYDIKKFAYKYYNITNKMNLYNFNCQHLYKTYRRQGLNHFV